MCAASIELLPTPQSPNRMMDVSFGDIILMVLN